MFPASSPKCEEAAEVRLGQAVLFELADGWNPSVAPIFHFDIGVLPTLKFLGNRSNRCVARRIFGSGTVPEYPWRLWFDFGEKLDTNLQDFCQIPPCPSSQRSWMRTADSPLITDLSDVDSHHSRDSIRTSAEAPNQVEPRSQVGNRCAMSRTLNIVRGPWLWWMKSHRQGHPTCDPAWIRRPCSGLQFVFPTGY